MEKAKTPQIRYTNLNYLNDRTKSNSVLMLKMINIYLEQTPPLVAAMKLSFKNRDWETLKKAAHKTIPSFLIMGMDLSYEKMARKIQEYATTMQNADEIESLVLELETVLVKSCDELVEEMALLKNKI